MYSLDIMGNELQPNPFYNEGIVLRDVRRKFDEINWILGAFFIVLIVTVLTLTFMLGQMMFEAFRFNSVIYKEYETKTLINRDILQSNAMLLGELESCRETK